MYRPVARALALLALLAPCVACDQTTKALAVSHLRGSPPSEWGGGLFRLVYAENPGAFLGMGRALPDDVRWLLFTVAVGALLLGLAVYVLKKALVRPAFVAMALMLAGGVGNYIDRVARPGGRVVDFAQLGVELPWGRLQTGIFNVADVHIVAGGMIMAWMAARRRPLEVEDEATERPAAPAA